jgi:DNA polymerase elongation subunit (family B)
MNFYTDAFQWGNSILVRKIENGEKINEEIKNFTPSIWVLSKNKTGWKTINNHNVELFNAGNIKETREFIYSTKSAGNFPVFGDIQTPYQWIAKEYPNDLEFDISKINICYIDIETECEQGFPNIENPTEQINVIGVKFTNDPYMIEFGIGPIQSSIEKVKYIECKNEFDLLSKFMEYWKDQSPDIVTGWNVKFFDFPYLINRIIRLFGEDFVKQLSPWGIIQSKESEVMGRKLTYYKIAGVSILDYIDLYKKFTYVTRERYTLDHIGEVELNLPKLDYSEYGTLQFLYKNNWTKFVEYNARDIEIVIKLESKLKLIELAIIMAYDAKTLFEDVFSQVRMWDVIIYNHLLKKKIVIPPRKEASKHVIEGAYVKEPHVGMSDWIVSFDLTSLYPHLIIQYNIGPDVLVNSRTSYLNFSIEDLLDKKVDFNFLLDKKYSVAANGVLFNKNKQGFLSELMQWMFDQRNSYKKQMIQYESQYESNKGNLSKEEELLLTNNISKYKNLQMAKKICLNSAYGALGNVGFRYYDFRLAEAVTKSGQLSIRWIENKLNKYLNNLLNTEHDYVIAADTDSVYVSFNEIVKRFMQNKSKEEIVQLIDEVCEKQITPYIDKCYDELAVYINAYSNKMKMKREVIADRGIWTAKKRYVLNVYNSEGIQYKEPKLKIMGIEAIRSSTPGVCRNKIKEALKIMLNSSEEDLQKYVSDFKQEFKSLDVEDISFPRSVNNISKYKDSTYIYKKGTPIHVRGSLLYNYYIKKLNIEELYPTIKEGEKIKFVYLKVPNEIHSDVVSFNEKLPKELNLHSCIDFNKQFEKTFIDPISIVLNAINWNYEKKSNLESFFV